MLACANAAERTFRLCLLGTLLLCGCSDPNGNFGFELTGLHSRVSGQHLQVELEQKISLSPEARSALENGVPLHLEIRAELKTSNDTLSASRKFEIRYMPLSNHYQLSSDNPAFVRTFPRLRHALAELSEVELDLPLPDVPAGEYPLSARSWLEKRRLPAPMRLPAWFAPNWQHDSGWKTWPVSIAGEGLASSHRGESHALARGLPHS